jgi:4-hydroxy-3-methylbut-2-enyl diphosphate reductase
MSKEKYRQLKNEVEFRMQERGTVETCHTICGQVANRGPWLEEFSRSADAIVFVGGKKSSNSKVLFNHCLRANPNSFFVSSPEELAGIELKNFNKIGVCGATSTPQWLMEDVAHSILKINSD